MATLDSSDVDTDEELQIAFSSGKLPELKKGLIKSLVPKKNCTNDVSGLQSKIEELNSKALDWLERMDVQSSEEAHQSNINEEKAIDPNDDFKREMHFLYQAQSAVRLGIEKLAELNVPTIRPNDYFAEMVKSDDQMRKVRQNLLSKQKRIEAIEKAKKLRELRTYGKKVQQEVLEQRRKEKKTTVEAVKRFSKGKGEKPSFLKEKGEFKAEQRSSRQRGPKKSKRREMKDSKYGSGGRKRGLKKNTSESSSDMSSFRRYKSKNSKDPKDKARRLGKSRRHKRKVQQKRK